MNNNGLSEEEVKKYRNLYGTNEIVKTKSNSFLKLLLMSLGDPMIKILLIVLALKFVFLFAEYLLLTQQNNIECLRTLSHKCLLIY